MNSLHLQLLILIIAGWVNRSQQDVTEYLQAENRVLREQLGGRRLRFTDRQRRRLAAKAKKTRPQWALRDHHAGDTRYAASLVPAADRQGRSDAVVGACAASQIYKHRAKE